MGSMRRAVVFFFLTMLTITVQAQKNLSPKFLFADARIAPSTIMRFSVSVKDAKLFFRVYTNKISVIFFYEKANTAIITATYDTVVREFSKDANIYFVDIVQEAMPETTTSRRNIAFNKINRLRSEYSSLRGRGQHIMIKEQRFDTANIDLIHKSFETSIASATFSQHATNIATIIAGSGNSSEMAVGVAPGADIGSSDFANLLPDDDAVLSAHDVNLENHSYGVGVENYYGNEAAAYDDQVNRHPNLVHVFSAGNSGNSVPEQGTYQGLKMANLSGNFKQAKNILTVTSVDTSFQIDARNSRGPAYDGRIKPELTAYGQDGTSDAAAIVSGVCALMAERYLAKHAQYPTASEVKSVLIATADDIDRPGIDYTSGYGSVNAYHALQAIDHEQVRTVTMVADETKSVSIDVPTNARQLRVAVSWIDPPAQPNSEVALVHDIEAVLDHAGKHIDPWTLNAKPIIDSLEAVAVRKPDHLNNVEYFTIDYPEAGTYNLNITAPRTVSSQEVAVAYWIEELKIFEWNNPALSDKFSAGEKTRLLWTAEPGQTGTLFVKINDDEWNTVATDVNLDHDFNWTPPDTTASMQLKMQIGNDDFVSSAFIVSQQPKLSVAFDCHDQFALAWTPVKGVSHYDVFMLEHDSIQLMQTVIDTLLVLNKPSGYYFAVTPRSDDHSGLRSETIRYTDQGAFCYIELFDAQRFQAGGVTLQLNLSSTFHVDHILIYKIVGDSAILLTEMPTKEIDRAMVWKDDQVGYGRVAYQAVVVLTSGVQLKSEVREVYLEKKDAAILFPNPVHDDGLTVLSEGAGLTARIIDAKTQIVIMQDLISILETIDTHVLPSGIYVFQLLRNGAVIDNERFIKN